MPPFRKVLTKTQIRDVAAFLAKYSGGYKTCIECKGITPIGFPSEVPMAKLKIRVNGIVHRVSGSPDTPLLYVLRNELHLIGPRFGCGLAQCGACSVLPGSEGDTLVRYAGGRGDG